MRAILFNKNTPVCRLNYDEQSQRIIAIEKYIYPEFGPLQLQTAIARKDLSPAKELDAWFRSRGIPSWRKGLQELLEELKIQYPEELLNRSFGLSLSDQYWLKPEGSSIEWKDINFFHYEFDGEGFQAFLFDSEKTASLSLKSPNNTTDGMVPKTWICMDGKRFLLKGGYTSGMQEPINEWLAAQICRRLGFSYCDYQVVQRKNALVSVCENFISDSEEIITADQIVRHYKKPNHISEYEWYINILEENGIYDARIRMEEMLIVDYLLLNTDRHLRNFGIIRNVETLKWTRTVPIFDTGQSMYAGTTTRMLAYAIPTGKLFSNTEKDFESYLPMIQKIRKLPFERLKGLADEYKALMQETKEITEISDKRIEFLASTLEIRIKKLESRLTPAKIL